MGGRGGQISQTTTISFLRSVVSPSHLESARAMCVFVCVWVGGFNLSFEGQNVCNLSSNPNRMCRFETYTARLQLLIAQIYPGVL